MLYLTFLVVLVQICPAVLSEGAKTKLVIDNDAGGDDAIAIFLALLNENHFNGTEVVALTTVNGNTAEDNVVHNNRRILKIAGRQDVPIYRGSKSSIVHTPKTTAYYGVDGLGDTGENVTDLGPVQEGNAVLRLIELSKEYEGQLVIVTIGPVTNIGLAIKLDPDFLKRLSHLYVAAGHIHDDTFTMAEFNARMDAESYRIIAQYATPDKVTILPFSQTKTFFNFTRDWRRNVLGGIDNDVVKAMNKYEQVALARPGDRWTSLDPSAIAVIVKSDLVDKYKFSKHDIVLCGDNRGITTNTFVEEDEANVRVIYSMKTDEYQQFLFDLFSH